jgi:lantibiotic biosynthesis protein
MNKADGKQLYRPCGVALLRATAVSAGEVPDRWPDLNDAEDCRPWLRDVWAQPRLARAIRHASIGLANQVDAICAGAVVSDKQTRRAAMSVVRYVLRAAGRHVPFGLFAGVAPVTLGATALTRWGDDHRSAVRVDAQWLGDVVARLEASTELLDKLDVVFTNLAVQRGDDLEAPAGATRVMIRYTRPIQAVREAAKSSIRFGVLIAELAGIFPTVPESKVRAMATSLLRQGFLITGLRAPMTIADPLAYVVHRLRAADAGAIPAVAPILFDLEAVEAEIGRHNQADSSEAERATIRVKLVSRMREISPVGRTLLAADLRLDCDVQVPEHVADELSRAATALIRLSRQPTGQAAWRDYYTAFCDRYGINALVPLADVLNPDAGIGLPATYPGSTATAALSGPSERDEELMAMAWEAMADGGREILLTDETIRSLTVGDPSIERSIPPHVELAAQVRATSSEALERGDYTLAVHPGQSAGTFTSRLAYLVPDAGLQDAYRGVPTAVEGALPVQLTFPPLYPHAENICRVPAYLPHVLSLGEHRISDEGVVSVDDLAVAATRDGLQLVSISRQRVIEPQMFHALALEKQSPPLARLLAHLSRGLGAAWHRFDWGPAAQQLAYLPRVRYRRSILSPATWRLNAEELPMTADDDAWRETVACWRQRWACPATVELQDDDRSLPLTLTEPAHAAIVRAHLDRHGFATFIETANTDDLGWIGGHAHDIAMPLVSTRSPSPAPAAAAARLVTNRSHGQMPASSAARWLYLKVHTHPERMNDLIDAELPRLLASLDQPAYWFARYRSPHERDHLRLRLQARDAGQYASLLRAVGVWAENLQGRSKISRLVVDTYYPETGRYGHGPAMVSAEAVFVADSRLVATQLRHLPDTIISPTVLTAVNMLSTVEGFVGGIEPACVWLKSHPAPVTTTPDRSLTDQVTSLVRGAMLRDHPGWDGEVADAWQNRANALGNYRQQLPDVARTDDVLESLLHMHHNRALGIDREGEATCRRLARQAAVAWVAQPTSVTP